MTDPLAGTPYSLPPNSEDVLERVSRREARIRERLKAVQTKVAENVGRAGDLRAYQRSREIYESNRIESVGPDLPTTARILENNVALDFRSSAFVSMLERSLKADPHLVAVLGLNAAKVLMNDLVLEYRDRPISSVDLRNLHARVCAGEWHAGNFKAHPNKIVGSSHVPPWPTDTISAVRELTDWLASPGNLPPTLVVATSHAWFTNIHPFHDGNGRLGRLLMNYVLAAAGQPPAIIRHDIDKPRYLAALAESDRGGDLMPLIDLMLDAQENLVRVLSTRRSIRSLVRKELTRASGLAWDRWGPAFAEFMAHFASALQARGVEYEPLGKVTPEAFEELRRGNSAGETWLAAIRGDEREVTLMLGASGSAVNRSVSEKGRFPSIRPVLRAPRYSFSPYRYARAGEAGRVREVLVFPANPPVVYLDTGEGLMVGGIRDSADQIALRLAASLRAELRS